VATRVVAVNFTANTVPYVAGVGKATAATAGLQKAALGAAAKFLAPAGLVMAFRKSFNAAVEFDTELTKLTTQIGLAAGDVDDLRRAALALGGSTTKGPQELAEAAFFIASAGLRGSAAMDVLRMSARMSAIGLGETKVVADTLTSALNAYGEESLSAAQASDVLVNAVRLGKASAEELAGSLGKVLPIASAMGVTFDEVGGIVAAMTRTGTDAATATTQLRAIMTSLLKPTNDAASAMLEMGLSASGLRQQIQDDGLWAALTAIQEATGGNADEFARLFPNVRALAGVMDLLGPQMESNAEIMALMASESGTAQEAFHAFSTTTRAELDRLGASWERFLIVSGDRTTGFGRNFVTTINAMLSGMGNAMERREDLEGFTNRAAVQMVAALRDIQAQTRGLTDAEREAAISTMEFQDAVERLREGYSMLSHEQAEATFGMWGMMRISQDTDLVLGDVQQRFIELSTALALANDEQRGVNTDAERWNRIAGKYAENTEGAADAQDDFAESLEEANAALAEQLELIDQQLDRVKRTIDPVYNLVRADQDLSEAQAEVNRMMEEGVEEGEDLAEAILDLMLKHAEYDHALSTSGVMMDGFIETLNTFTTDGKLTEAMLDVLIERVSGFGHELDKVDGRVTRSTHIHTIITRPQDEDWSPAVSGGSAQARALGGPISAGRPYLVGERGPELIVPTSAGNVIPAGQLARMMMSDPVAGSGVVIENYTSVRDTDDDALIRKLEFAQMAGRL